MLIKIKLWRVISVQGSSRKKLTIDHLILKFIDGMICETNQSKINLLEQDDDCLPTILNDAKNMSCDEEWDSAFVCRRQRTSSNSLSKPSTA